MSITNDAMGRVHEEFAEMLASSEYRRREESTLLYAYRKLTASKTRGVVEMDDALPSGRFRPRKTP